MYLNHMMFSLKPGDYITYTDLNGIKRQLKYIKDTGLVKAIVGQDYSPQQQFEDEFGAIVHVPLNAWKFTKIQPLKIKKEDYGF